MTLEKAINVLKRYYIIASTSPYVRDKVAWALYKTWREADGGGSTL